MRYIILALAMILGLGNADQRIKQVFDQQGSEAAFAEAKIAAHDGDPRAHDWLGWFYETGDGAPLDVGMAEKHYRIAAAKGDNHSMWRLGVLIDKGTIAGSPEEAVKFFEAGAANDYTNAIVSLAVMQVAGRGTKKSPTGAFANYRRAAGLGDSGGVRGVGIMYYLGEAVQRDPKEAMAWFLVAAAMGNENGDESLEMAVQENPGITFETVRERAEAIALELGI